MLKDKRVWIAVGIACLLVILGVVALLIWGAPGQNSDPTGGTSGEKATYTVQIKNSSGLALEGVGVYIYEDSTQQELITFAKTDAEGKMSFTDAAKDGYVAVLDPVPTGYKVEEYYPLTGELTQIILEAGSLADVDVESVQYKLGDMMMDFTVTAVDGTEYKLSELLKTKKAVVLNFWYMECAPCKAEFPFLQEAYEEYKDSIELLALNPVNPSADDIAAFQKELGLTFPMVQADKAWEQMMQLKAYPTTVVIDRFGNISLIHAGTIPDAKTFKDTFAFFTAEDYEPTVVEDITTLLTEEEKGSEENPAELGGVTSFEVTVGPGQVFYTDLYKVNDMYLQIRSNDAYVLYNNKTYEPNNGLISILLSCPDNYTPAKVGIGNSSDKEQTFAVALIPKSGTFSNPYGMSLGEFNVSVAAGNEQGVYYVYTAKEDGTITAQCLSATSGVDYDYSLYNLSNSAMRNMKNDGVTDPETGAVTLSVQLKKGQRVMFSVGTLPDSSNSYPGANFKFLVTFTAGEVEDAPEETPKVTYTVTITDKEENPVSGVTVNLKGTVIEKEATETEAAITKDVEVNVVTDDKGVATTEQYPGTLTATIKIPVDYKLEQTQYELTPEAPSVTVQMEKIVVVMADYVVKVETPDLLPVPGVQIMVGESFATTDADGKIVFNLQQGQYTAFVTSVPKGYEIDQASHAFAEGATELTVSVGYAAGTEKNPIVVRDRTYIATGSIPAGEKLYYTVSGVGGTTLKIESANATVSLNGGGTITATDGVVSVPIPAGSENLSLVVGNNSTEPEGYRVNFVFPLGSRQNPEYISNTLKFSATLEAGDTDGYYFYRTYTNDGTLTLTYRNPQPTVENVVTLSCGTNSAVMTNGQATIDVMPNEPVLVHVIAKADPEGNYPAGSVTLKASYKKQELPDGMSRYTVTLKNAYGVALEGISVQLMKDGVAAGEVMTTDATGTVSAILESATYNVTIVDELYTFDAAKGILTEENNAVILEVTKLEPPVPEGKTRYGVTVMDYNGSAVADVMVQFRENGVPAAAVATDEYGYASAVLDSGEYTAALAFSGGVTYYYVSEGLTMTAEAPKIQINVTSNVPGEAVENWAVGSYQPVMVGGTYITLQANISSYYLFRPTEQGTYRITTSNPAAVVTDWGSSNYPAKQVDTEYIDNAYSISVSDKGIGQEFVIGVSGEVSDCILIITRIGDAAFNPAEADATVYEPKATLAPFTLSITGGQRLNFVDILGKTEDYTVVYNETDGYYHLGTVDGPVLMVRIGAPAPHAKSSLYDVAGGSGLGGGLKYSFYDPSGKFVKYEFSPCILRYAENMDTTHGVYPLTEDLVYILQNAGNQAGWYDESNGNFFFETTAGEKLEGVNAEIAWMFAVCYLDQVQTTAFTLRAPTLEAKTEPVEEATEQREEIQSAETVEQTEPAETETTEPSHPEETQATEAAPAETTAETESAEAE